MEKRTDRLTAVYVDLAINVVGSHGLAAGVRALLECGTSSAVITDRAGAEMEYHQNETYGFRAILPTLAHRKGCS
jgi:hypothetical protein